MRANKEASIKKNRMKNIRKKETKSNSNTNNNNNNSNGEESKRRQQNWIPIWAAAFKNYFQQLVMYAWLTVSVCWSSHAALRVQMRMYLFIGFVLLLKRNKCCTHINIEPNTHTTNPYKHTRMMVRLECKPLNRSISIIK